MHCILGQENWRWEKSAFYVTIRMTAAYYRLGWISRTNDHARIVRPFTTSVFADLRRLVDYSTTTVGVRVCKQEPTSSVSPFSDPCALCRLDCSLRLCTYVTT